MLIELIAGLAIRLALLQSVAFIILLWLRWRVPVLITLSLSALAVVYFDSQFLLRFLAWPYVALLWPVLIAICMLLWFRGKHLDREARNPLRGILPQPFDKPESP